MATGAWLKNPFGIVVDGARNLYIADTDNHRIRKVDAAGVISTVAGDGTPGHGGDGGPAVQARLNFPRGVAVDGAGNLYIADRDNHRIRKVDAAGVISTVAGDGTPGYGGDGGPAVQARLNFPRGLAADGAGNLYIADIRESLNKVVLARWLVEVVRKERLQPGCRRILRLNPADFDFATPIFDPAATASTPLLRLGAGMDARLLYCGAQAVA